MGGDWEYQKIADLAEKVACGPFGASIKVSTFVEEGIPVISGQHLHGFRLQEEEFNYISGEHAQRLKNANVFRGDVIFTAWGSIGQVAYIPDNSRYAKYVVSQRQFYMRCDTKKIIPEFATYYFKTPEGQHRLTANSSPTGVPSIAQPVTYLKSLTIPVPPLNEQRAIVQILGTLNDKIELNRRMNKTLEDIARAIFKSWFVDFDPVRARVDGRQPEGVDAGTAALFSDSFKDSPIGKIPEGWEIGRVGDVFDVTMGQSPPGETYNERGEGVLFFQGTRDFGVRFPAPRVFCTAPSRFAQKGDTLVSVRAPVGEINMAFEDCCIGRGLSAVRHKMGFDSYTFYAMSNLREGFDRFEAEGTVFGSMSKQKFLDLLVLIPPKRLTQRFEDTFVSIDKRIENSHRESTILSNVRDTLLPKLISGEIRVKDAEKSVEEHARQVR